MRRIVTFLLVMILVLTMLPVSVSASDATVAMRKLEEGEEYTKMHASQEMIDVIKDFEGFSHTPYADNTQWTVGYGSYCGDIDDPKPGVYLTEDEAEQRLRSDLKRTYEPIVNNYCKSIGRQPSQQQFDALLDITYNAGGSWTRGKAITSVMENPTDEIAVVRAFGSYSRSGGKISYTHINRRVREALIFLYGEYYRAYGNQDCKSDIEVVSNNDLPHFKAMVFKTNSGKFSNGKNDIAEYYHVDEYFGSFPEVTRSGYTCVGWEITKRSNKSVDDGEIVDIYSVVEENLHLTAVWEEGEFEPELPEAPAPELEELPDVTVDMDRLPFEDVPENAWFRDAVRYVYRNEFMNGTSATTFAPGSSMTRGMLVTVLYRMDGSVEVTDEERACFDDIGGAYYTDAVAWAYANGIVNGVTENTFEPNRVVTRQEAITIFYRYCVDYSLMDVESGMALEGFQDENQVAPYAVEPFVWAVNTGLVAGSAQDGGIYLTPASELNRAQAATLLQRCVEEVLN